MKSQRLTSQIEITAWDPDTPDLERLLAESEVEESYLWPSGSNYVFLLQLRHPEAGTAHAIYKPRKGEAPLWDFPNGTLYRRERASYLVARALGWDFIPATIIRDGPHGIGAVQTFIIHDPSDYRAALTASPDALRRIAVFDVVTNNADRKGGHCLRGVDGRIWGIDHGLTFHTEYKLRTVLWDFVGEPVPGPLCADLERILMDLQQVGPLRLQLEELLAKAEIDMFAQRTRSLLERGVFPPPGQRRAVPWPPF
jgi:hypothetical protein